MKKVLFMIPNLGHGGAEKVLVNLVNHMDKNKFEITVMALYDEGVNKCFLSKEVQYKNCFRGSFKGISHLLKIYKPETLYSRFVKDNYDIVISYLEGQTARIASGCNDTNTKLVSWIHVEQHTAKQAARTFRTIDEMQRCYSRFDKIICVSEYVKKDFCSFIPDKDVAVLYNTVESDNIRIQANESVEDKLFSSEEIKLCGIGTLKKSKGFDRLLRIHKKLRSDGFPVHTYLLGEGEEQKKLENYVRQEKLDKTVTFLGYQKNPYKYLKRCDIFVCTSFAEGFSTAATEALILGIPVCTVEVSGMKEMLGQNNEFGLVTANDEDAFYEGVRKLLTDNTMLKHYQEMALKRGSLFETDSTVKAVEDMLLKL